VTTAVAPAGLDAATPLPGGSVPWAAVAAPPALGAGGGMLQGGGGGAPQLRYYALDALGSVRVVFDAAGQVVSRADYEPFGAAVPASTTGTLPRQQYTGHERDGEVGVDYLGARLYAPTLGRLPSVDPLYVGAVEEPQRWNRYVYALNAPTIFVDPDGRQPCDEKVQQHSGPGSPGNPCARVPDFSVSVTGVDLYTTIILPTGAGAMPTSTCVFGVCPGGSIGSQMVSSALQAIDTLVGTEPLISGELGEGGAPIIPEPRTDTNSGMILMIGAVSPAGRGRVAGALSAQSVRRGFRKALSDLIGGPPKFGMHAHHTFPVEFVREFGSLGIGVGEARYGAWWDSAAHLKAHGAGYNSEWRAFLTTGPTREAALARGRDMGRRHGFKTSF
jgi:RHS repeat-associated protein